MSAARNGSHSKRWSTAASAPPATTGTTEAVYANGRRISQTPPARRRSRPPSPSRRSSARASTGCRSVDPRTAVGRVRPDGRARPTRPGAPRTAPRPRCSSSTWCSSWTTGWRSGRPEPGRGVEGHRLGGDVLARPAQHERVEQLVRDEVAGRRVVLGPPGGRDPVAQVGLEAGPGERDVRQHRHHVDDERLALGPVERLAAGGVDEREQVAGGLDRRRVAAGLGRGLAQALQDAGQARDRFGGPGEVAVGLLAGQRHELLAVRGDDERDPVGRREHRLDRRQARRRRRQALAGPQRPDLVHRRRHALDGRDRVVRDAHLLEAQRQARAQAHDDPAGQHLVERRAGHRQDDRDGG